MYTRRISALLVVLCSTLWLNACGFDPLDTIRPKRTPSPTPTLTPVPMPTPQNLPPQGRVKGNPNARVVFVEWSDFQ